MFEAVEVVDDDIRKHLEKIVLKGAVKYGRG
jgi:hypothetical protein